MFGDISTSPIYAIRECFLGFTGGIQILQAPQILAAVFPWHAFFNLLANKVIEIGVQL